MKKNEGTLNLPFTGAGRFLLCLFLAGFLTAAAAAQEHSAVMIKGNSWITGIPGFGANVFPAISAEYRSGDTTFSIWVSGEPLVFSQAVWESRTLPRGSRLTGVMQRDNGGTLLVGFPLNSENETGAWTVLFQFPRRTADTGFDDAGADRLIAAWTSRFRYFMSLVKTASDISLPAVVTF
ncbi:MAG: hypothetical protein LBN21_02780 [Treponema sp.]|jgi:hypothetical protein|nr:hypothetical protein [Treponema sp.]